VAPSGLVRSAFLYLNQPDPTQATLTPQQGDTGTCSTVECPDLFLDDASGHDPNPM